MNKQILEQNIITALDLQALDDDKKIALVDKMSEVVQKRLTLRALEEMSEADKKDFERLLDTSPEQVSDFLQKVLPNFLEMVNEEVVKMKKEMVEKFKEV